MRTYHILDVNCDCSKHRETRLRLPHNSMRMAIRCKHCRKQLGWMDYGVVGKIKAEGEIDALRRFKEGKIDTKSGLLCFLDKK